MATATASPPARPRRSLLAETLSARELADMLETIAAAKRLLSPEDALELDEISDFRSATRALTVAWTAVSRALDGDADAMDAIGEATDLFGLLVRIRSTEDIVRRRQVARRTESIRVVREALRQFRGIRRVGQLRERCPKVMAQLGFDRAMLSLVNKSVWTPASAYVDGDPEWARTIVESGQEHPQQLIASLPEFDLVRRKQGILVTEAQQNPNVNKAIVAPSLSRSYVAAAVMPEDTVIGLLHCDNYFHRGDVGEIDRDLLNLFAEGFGYVLERTILLERAAAIQAEATRLSTSMASAIDGFADDNAGVTPTFDTPWATGTGLDVYGLTRRELEVLRLMAAGDTNTRISSRLVISAGTVKSHVKHILRKLGASNRAEAVSCWFTAQSR
jgi:DNA-binding CsgD family transcriptional regulator